MPSLFGVSQRNVPYNGQLKHVPYGVHSRNRIGAALLTGQLASLLVSIDSLTDQSKPSHELVVKRTLKRVPKRSAPKFESGQFVKADKQYGCDVGAMQLDYWIREFNVLHSRMQSHKAHQAIDAMFSADDAELNRETPERTSPHQGRSGNSTWRQEQRPFSDARAPAARRTAPPASDLPVSASPESC